MQAQPKWSPLAEGWPNYQRLSLRTRYSPNVAKSQWAVIRGRVKQHPIMSSLGALVTLGGTLFHWAKDVLDWISRWDSWNAHASEAIKGASIAVGRAPVWIPEACYLLVVVCLLTVVFRRPPESQDAATTTLPSLNSKGTPVPQTKTTVNTQRSPKVEAVGARLCWVVEQDGGYAEWDTHNLSTDSFDTSLRALVAIFRHEGGPRVEAARARIDFVDGLANVVENIDYGCWLGETVNWADFDFGDTKYLVIALADAGQAFAINDNRRDAGARGTTARPLPPHTIRAYVSVLLLDGEFESVLAQPIKAVFDIGFGVTGPRISHVAQPTDMHGSIGSSEARS